MEFRARTMEQGSSDDGVQSSNDGARELERWSKGARTMEQGSSDDGARELERWSKGAGTMEQGSL
ncbi:MAG: hypothetical protein KME26_12360 [Oscillatoria princeps RMCB-10]|nr:hypothetical protein [Oscillatoria princeps RMCB-10]